MNAIFISSAPEVIWNAATGRHRAPLWNTAFETLTAPTESGQLFETGGQWKESLSVKEGALFRYSSIKVLVRMRGEIKQKKYIKYF